MMSSLSSIITDIIVTGFEFWCLLILLSNEESKNTYIKRIWIGLIIGIVVLMSYMGVIVLIKMSVIILYITISGKLVYQCRMIKLLGYSVLYCVCIHISELIVVQAWNIFNQPIFSMNCIYEDFVLSVCIMIHMIFFIVICLLKKLMKLGSSEVKTEEVLPIIMLGIPFLLVLFSVHISMPQLHDTYVRNLFLISSVGIMASFIYMVMFTQRYVVMMERKKEEEKSLYELEMKNAYYMEKLQAQEQIRELYHDLKNHLLYAEKEELSEEIQEKLRSYENYYETGNEFLNVILADKIGKAKKDNIQLECNVDFSQGDFIEALDISTIFGNLLDNAIEASKKIENGEKYIFINVAVKGQLLIIVIKNSMRTFACEQLQTDKWNKTYHGYGLSNVRKSLKKYNGELKMHTDEKEFRVSVVIPLPIEKYEKMEYKIV